MICRLYKILAADLPLSGFKCILNIFDMVFITVYTHMSIAFTFVTTSIYMT